VNTLIYPDFVDILYNYLQQKSTVCCKLAFQKVWRELAVWILVYNR